MFVGQEGSEETANKTSLDVCFGQLVEAGCTRYYHGSATRYVKDTISNATVASHASIASLNLLLWAYLHCNPSKSLFQSSSFSYSHRLKMRRVLKKLSNPQRLILNKLSLPSQRTKRNRVSSLRFLKRVIPNATISTVTSSPVTLHSQRSYQNFALSLWGIQNLISLCCLPNFWKTFNG